MGKLKSPRWTAKDYDRAANAYLRRLPLEHFMEAISAAKQREFTIESFALVAHRCPEVQCFNELLIQYWFKGRLRRVVPDNFVRKCALPPVTDSSYNLELEPVGPLLVMEYVSPSNPRKDYKDNFLKYERELKVPYYLLFYPERQDLRLYHLEEEAYRLVPPNAHGRLALPELELEIGLHQGWVRFWHRGHLLELPGELQQRAENAQAEVARLRAQLEELESGKKKPRRPRN